MGLERTCAACGRELETCVSCGASMASLVPGLGASLMLPAGEVSLCSECTGSITSATGLGRLLFKLQSAAVEAFPETFAARKRGAA